MAILVSFATLPPFFLHFDLNSIAKWLVNLVTLGGLAFAAGWVYGKLSNLGSTSANDSSVPKGKTETVDDIAKREAVATAKKKTTVTCPRCGGPVEEGVCWSCGARL